MQDRPITQSEMREMLRKQADEMMKTFGPGKWVGQGKNRKLLKRQGWAGARPILCAAPHPAEAVPTEQRVYVIGCAGEPVKIGIALDVQSRLGTLQTGHPRPLRVYFEVVPPKANAREIERKCHKALAEHRLKGEWFDVPPERAVETVCAVLAA